MKKITPFKHILVATNGSKFSEEAVKYAVKLARETGVKLTVLHVANVQGYIEVMWHDMKKRYMDEAEMIMKKLREELNFDDNVNFIIKEGIPYRKIVETAYELGCDLIVLGSHGHSSLEKILLGSVAERVIGISHIPVMIVPPRE